MSAPRFAAALIGAALVAATLWPGHAVLPPPLPAGNEPFGLADMLRNAVAYLPLGAALSSCRLPVLRALLCGSALSAILELCQLVVPGRNPNALDWLCNTAGTAAGILLHRTARLWLLPAPRQARALALGASAGVIALLAATALLLAPAPTRATFYGHRTPDLAHLAPYQGSVLSASLDGIVIPHGEIEESDALRASLAGSFALNLHAIAGPPPPSLAALLLITDLHRTEILLVGPDREDLIVRYRTRGDGLGLETPRVRLRRALLAVAPGADLEVDVQRAGADLCIALDGRRACGLGFTLGDGWQLIAPDLRALDAARPLLAALWIALLFAPLGFWMRGSAADLLAGAAALAVLFVLPGALRLLPTPPMQLGAAACGAALGAVVRRLIEASPRRARSAVV